MNELAKLRYTFFDPLLEAVGMFFSLFGTTVWYSITPPFRIKDIINQLVFVAYESLPIIAFCVSSAAAVTIIESSFHMKLIIKNDSMVPGFAALLILRELGAVVTGLLITSRVGAGIAAEVGSMKITEQIDAYKMLGLNPIRFIVVPRFVGSIIGVGTAVLIANIICLAVAMFITQASLGYSQGSFLASMRNFVTYQDLWFATIKGATFGAIIPIFSCFYGFRCKSGAEGVGLATTNSVVSSSVAIIFFFFFLSYIFSHFY